jgi:two-component system phosphate regulon sensor histidine kinase PhoR
LGRHGLIWKLLSAYLFLIGLCTAVGGWYIASAFNHFFWSQKRLDLEQTTTLMMPLIEPLIGDGRQHDLKSLCARLASETGAYLALFDANGGMLVDTENHISSGHQAAGSPEVIEAIAGRQKLTTRFNHILKSDVMYLARPVVSQGNQIGVVRMGVLMTEVNRSQATILLRIVLSGLVVAVAGVVAIGVLVTRHISRPIEYVRNRVDRFAAGDLSRSLYVPESNEFGPMVTSLNHMARELDQKINTLTERSRRHETVLASMVEGVLAVDAEARIVWLNEAAADFLSVDPEKSRGRTVFEMIRNPELHKVVSHALKGHRPVEIEITIRRGQPGIGPGKQDAQECQLQAVGTLLQGDQVARNGAVIVLHDVTRLRHLETIRQQFVANVSHELKTPITAIKSGVEALISHPHEGDAAPTRDSERFLKIIARQADRLNDIVDDLLMLARVERDTERHEVELELVDVASVLEAAVETCYSKLKDKRLRADIAATHLQAMLNARLLEQAIVNLLDNAIRYSPEGATVKITVEKQDGEILIGVHDVGPGIPTQDLPRIFERFYRVDPSRNRALGGTGLGLAIVKHIALAHGGEVTVLSTVGKGASFVIHLPALPALVE